ncbi:uncharacterized protein LOC115630469 [Scaptodrosophila lebanonensis]|uniref:Uncharacterized protein LOC115630469 n=1 Tax=Drosophila lebanonensis TaxID=7225 RepID=A0A6J2U3B5_DROLE|nr:uncharacterized protein LOC115630469 [Scaptodrosophila lebanonensis]
MKACLFLVGFLATLLPLDLTSAAVSIGVFKNEAHPGKCYIDEHTILSVGETATAPGCQQISCGANSMAQFATCGLKGIGPPCKLGALKYPDADYPKCCINVMHCPDGDSEI